ncbi:MAG: bifunctional hydroxymethylpyrimidine kinase/phosphomethylpyrimidine kinase [Duncaniella sp.]|nr:bifunctional hydroxymethylpyrimidine kinase/phosphomethylpyrimidine kinase [Muribaculum sp.]MCM1255814.1 bifunctional hydroxymethylpyrimidine kinase/phosphomethylpyrimidine kinase [Duncaniella sp.]
MRKYFTALTIAGSDSSGGAGIQADLKTISAIGCYGMSVVTSITAQNTTGVRSIMPVTPQIVADQIDMVMEDIPPLAIKIGMLCNAEIASTVADRLEYYCPGNVVIDPVMVSTSGSVLLENDAIEVIASRIFPFATLITPNQQEVKVLTGETDLTKQASCLRAMGCKDILIKGGDTDRTDVKVDFLFLEGKDEPIALISDAFDTPNTHGTGCTLSSAIASYLALGYDLVNATKQAKLYITHALEAGSFITVGNGHGPVNHFFSPRRMKNYNPKRM